MQKAALQVESILILVLVGSVLWQAALSAHAQALVDSLASEAETPLEPAAPYAGRLPGLPVSDSRRGTPSEPRTSTVVGGEEPTRTTEGA